MRIEIIKGQNKDSVAIERDDGSRRQFDFPKKGLLPHDAIHFFVERECGLTRGFWGLVASGLDPVKVAQMAAAGGHASSQKATNPDPAIVELLQAERLVECFEAEHWSGGEDDEGIVLMAKAGWDASFVAPISALREKTGPIRDRIGKFAARWQDVHVGDRIVLEWTQ